MKTLIYWNRSVGKFIIYPRSSSVRPPAPTTSRVIVVRGRVLVRNGRKKVQKLFKLFKII